MQIQTDPPPEVRSTTPATQDFPSCYTPLAVPHLAALKTATVNAADLMRLTAKTGSLDPGKWADIIAVGKNPLNDIRVLQNVKFVMEAGLVYKDESK